jgi:AcrR family transcriptional regulator
MSKTDPAVLAAAPTPARKAPRRRRVNRMDGDATRARILDTAGRLFAERGYAQTTSKAICERAECNMAAVNYHFGSRDDLYLAVLEEVHKHLISLDALQQIARKAISPQKKLGLFLDKLIIALLDDQQSWYSRVWAREVLSPSPLLPTIIRNEAQPKFNILSTIISELCGIPAGHPALARCTLSVIAPCMVLLIVNRDVARTILPIFERPAAELVEHMKRFVFAGLDAIAAAHAEAR